MRITKVYTRTGDAGKTRLAGGQQVWKDSLRVEAYGIVDELNSSVGVVRAFNAEKAGTHAAAPRLEEELRWVQNKLFDTGGLLATAPGQTFKNMPQVTAQDVTRLERLIDECQKDLGPLKEFILPGGGKVSGLLHQARTVCRGAERVCVRLSAASLSGGESASLRSRHRTCPITPSSPRTERRLDELRQSRRPPADWLLGLTSIRC